LIKLQTFRKSLIKKTFQLFLFVTFFFLKEKVSLNIVLGFTPFVNIKFQTFLPNFSLVKKSLIKRNKEEVPS